MKLIKKILEPVDMTTGSPLEKIIMFAIPMLLGNIAQQLYNTVDSIVVGKYIGDQALAAVGSAGPILNLLIVLFIGISMGAGVMTSQYVGAREREELSLTVGNCIMVTAIATVLVMVTAWFGVRPLLEMLQVPASIIDWCTSYLLIMFLGSAGMAYYNILGGILRGLGDSVSALVYLLVATVINIILDVYFVAVLGMGVDGVAYATVIAQAVSALLCVWKLARMKEFFDLKPCYIKVSKKHTREMVKIGLPSGITQAILSMGMILIQSLTNRYGELFIAANVIVMRVDGFAMLPSFSFGNALTTFAGQNFGAGKYERVEEGARRGTILAAVLSACITVLILLFGRNLMGIFTDTKELVNLSMQMMKIMAVGYIAMAVSQSLFGIMRGVGITVVPMWITIISTIFIRVPLAYAMAYATRTPLLPNGRQECIYISLLCSWVAGAVIAGIYFKKAVAFLLK